MAGEAARARPDAVINKGAGFGASVFTDLCMHTQGEIG